MTQNDHQIKATNLLSLLIQHQPNLIATTSTADGADGERAAKFCSTFIDTYAKYLAERK
jgi:hypothetical protein